jgi:hypothetical protein
MVSNPSAASLLEPPTFLCSFISNSSILDSGVERRKNKQRKATRC